MADKEKEQTEATETPEATPARKSSMMTYLIMGVGFLVVMVAAIGITVMLFGGKSDVTSEEPTQEPVEKNETTATNSQSEKLTVPASDTLAAQAIEQDPDLMDEIMANLQALDYEPSTEEIEAEEAGLSVEDSLEKVEWFEKEDKRLKELERELNARESKLTTLDREVTKKLTKLEQAESTRIANLAKLYDDMDSRSVAKLMHNLDDETVVSILPRMKTKNASEVLALLPPERAARLSKQMITIAVDK